MPVLAPDGGPLRSALGVYLVNGFHRFKDGRILPVWTSTRTSRSSPIRSRTRIVSTSLLLAGTVTALALLIGYPLAYALHTRVRSARASAPGWPWSSSVP